MFAWVFRLFYICAITSAVYCILYSTYTAHWIVNVNETEAIATSLFACQRTKAQGVICKSLYQYLDLRQKATVWCLAGAILFGFSGAIWAVCSCALCCVQRCLDTPLPVFAFFALLFSTAAIVNPIVQLTAVASPEIVKQMTSFAYRSSLWYRAIGTAAYAVAVAVGTLSNCFA